MEANFIGFSSRREVLDIVMEHFVGITHYFLPMNDTAMLKVGGHNISQYLHRPGIELVEQQMFFLWMDVICHKYVLYSL